MNALYHNLLGDSEASGELLAGMWSWLKHSESPDDLVRIVNHRHCPAEVLAEAGASLRPEVRTAWLLRPERTVDELVGALERERRGDVLAAVAASELIGDETVERLAALHKRPVARALMRRAGLSDAVVSEIILTLDPAMRSMSRNDRGAVIGFVRRRVAAVAPLITKLTSPHLLTALVESEAALDEAAQLHFLTRCVIDFDAATVGRLTPWEAMRFVDDGVRSLAGRTDLVEAVGRRLLAWGEEQGRKGTRLAPILQDLAVRMGSGGQGAPNANDGVLALAASSDDSAVLQDLWERSSPVLRKEVAQAMWSNPVVTGELLIAAAVALGQQGGLDDKVGEALAQGRLTDDDLVAIGLELGVVWRVAALVKVATDGERVRDAMAIGLLTSPSHRYVQVDELVECGLIDQDNFDRLPLSRLVGRSVILHEWLAGRLVEVLGRDERAWALFDQLCSSRPASTLDELCVVVAASLCD